MSLSSVLLPAPFGPTTASRVPGLDREVDVLERRPGRRSRPTRRTATRRRARGHGRRRAPPTRRQPPLVGVVVRVGVRIEPSARVGRVALIDGRRMRVACAHDTQYHHAAGKGAVATAPSRRLGRMSRRFPAADPLRRAEEGPTLSSRPIPTARRPAASAASRSASSAAVREERKAAAPRLAVADGAHHRRARSWSARSFIGAVVLLQNRASGDGHAAVRPRPAGRPDPVDDHGRRAGHGRRRERR